MRGPMVHRGAPIRVTIVSEHTLFRKGLASLLTLGPGIAVAAETERFDPLAYALTGVPCDVLLLDAHIGGASLPQIEMLSRRFRLLVVTASQQLEEAAAAMRAGASGAVFADLTLDALIEAIRTVARDEVWMPPALRRHLTQPEHSRPTGREREVIRYVALGLRNAEVAGQLGISSETVKKHLRNVFQKLQVRDRVELAHYALRQGLVEVRRMAS
jgi:two-component system nitrate/nitrite response regulator NarL